MDRRSLAAGIAVLALAGLALVATALDVSLEARRGISSLAFVLGVGTAALAALAALLVIAHQYVRWEPYRPAIHLAAALVAFVAILVWWLDPGVFGGDDPLTGEEKRTIRIAGAGLLLFLLFSLARYLDSDDGKPG